MKAEYLPDGSPDCPLIRLFEFDASGANRLKSHFDSLAEGRVQKVLLTELSDVSGVGGCHLVLKTSSQDRGVVRESDIMSFDWLLTPQGWRSVADLTEPFCRGTEPDHYQWLDETSDTSMLLSPSGYW